MRKTPSVLAEEANKPVHMEFGWVLALLERVDRMHRRAERG